MRNRYLNSKYQDTVYFDLEVKGEPVLKWLVTVRSPINRLRG